MSSPASDEVERHGNDGSPKREEILASIQDQFELEDREVTKRDVTRGDGKGLLGGISIWEQVCASWDTHLRQ